MRLFQLQENAYSIVLMAVFNAEYEFLLVDVGDAGRQSDGSVYTNSHLGYAIDNNLLNIPNQEKIGNSDEIFPYVFLADDAFGLKTYLMKPYCGQNIPVIHITKAVVGLHNFLMRDRLPDDSHTVVIVHLTMLIKKV